MAAGGVEGAPMDMDEKGRARMSIDEVEEWRQGSMAAVAWEGKGDGEPLKEGAKSCRRCQGQTGHRWIEMLTCCVPSPGGKPISPNDA